ncbi:MAG: YbaY family lipoprotein [Thermoanaerobaculia bacterium]
MKIAHMLVVLLLSFAALSCASSNMDEGEMLTVTGSVSYLQRIALGPESVVHVRLVDLELVDKPGYLVAQKAIHTPGQVPLEFELSYWERRLESGHTYALQARIEDAGRVIFTTKEDVKFDATQPGRHELVLEPAD